MDIMTALATVSQSIKIAKDLRDLERDLDSASYKAKMAELYTHLADIKMALSDAKEALHDKDREVQKLKDQVDALRTGDICPICQMGRLKTTAVKEHPTFGVMGHQEHTLTCQNAGCGHSEKRKVIPK
ncbi:hypothetical protein RFN25_24515 [Mesorhizobium abyssinicae]|uniref:hypothetical protein n=1 Tax=Mesorhizobium abyssinicae TaxID=1209958 RepID=UPI002A2498E2|nr:hypothetical protein [Mesorhizobium abyssinicae]MDX8436593.1 hypothetical protein [Mesorhizobium abyssinicae]